MSPCLIPNWMFRFPISRQTVVLAVNKTHQPLCGAGCTGGARDWLGLVRRSLRGSRSSSPSPLQAKPHLSLDHSPQPSTWPTKTQVQSKTEAVETRCTFCPKIWGKDHQLIKSALRYQFIHAGLNTARKLLSGSNWSREYKRLNKAFLNTRD